MFCITRAMNVLRTVFRQLARGGVTFKQRDASAISEASGGLQTPWLTPEHVLLKRLGRAGGRRKRRADVKSDALAHIPVICGRRPSPAGDGAPPRDRCLITVPRLTQRQTRSVDSGATSAQPEQRRSCRGRPGSACRGVKIGHINAQSLVPKVDAVNSLLESERFDLLCVSETWLTPDTLPRFMVFPGYAMVRRDRAESTDGQRVRGGGVAVIHREELHCQVLQTPPTSLLETLWVSVSVRGGRPAIVGVTYRPPAGSASQAVDELQEQLRDILARGKPTYLL